MNQNTDYFVLGNISSQHIGIVMQGPPKFKAPEPKVETVSVPGRNGDLVFYDGSYSNVEGSVDCYVLQWQVYDALAAVNNWINSRKYEKLVFHGDENAYRMARVVNGADVAARLRLLNPFTIQFDCKPQRFLTSGDYPIRMRSSGVLDNPGYGGLPLIRVRGSGEGALRINGQRVDFSGIDEYVDLDCDLQDAYKGTENKNSSITCDEFPQLMSGRNTVWIDGGITSIEITPRWYTL